MYILAYFPKFFKNHAFNFRAFGRKTQIVEKILKILEEKSIEKNDFSIISGKVVAKNRALENNTRFLPHTFPIWGGAVPVFPPSRRL